MADEIEAPAEPAQDVDDRLAEAFIDLVKPVIVEMIMKMLTGPAMRTLVGNVSQLNDTIKKQNEMLATLTILVQSLPSVRGSKTRGKQLVTLLAIRFREEMQAAGCTPEQIDTVIRSLMVQTRETAEGARRGAGRVMAGKRPRRKLKDK